MSTNHNKAEGGLQAESVRRSNDGEVRSIAHYAADFRRNINNLIRTNGHALTNKELYREESRRIAQE